MKKNETERKRLSRVIIAELVPLLNALDLTKPVLSQLRAMRPNIEIPDDVKFNQAYYGYDGAFEFELVQYYDEPEVDYQKRLAEWKKSEEESIRLKRKQLQKLKEELGE